MAGRDKITFKHKGVVQNGELYLEDVSFYKEDLVRHNGLNIHIEIHEEELDHTFEQMKFFRGPITSIALQSNAFAGYSKLEFQELMKTMFLAEKKDVRMLNGIIKEVIHIPSLGNLKLKEMNQFINDVIQFLAEEGITIKSINEQ
jgi:hypothetical protein